MRQISPIHTYATFWHSSCFPSIAKRKVEASVDVQCFNFENVPNPGDFNIELGVCHTSKIQHLLNIVILKCNIVYAISLNLFETIQISTFTVLILQNKIQKNAPHFSNPHICNLLAWQLLSKNSKEES